MGSSGTKFLFGGDPVCKCQCVSIWESDVFILLFSLNHTGFFIRVYSVTVLK